MKIRNLLQALVLSVVLVASAAAGEMNNPGISNPPPSCSDPEVQCTQTNQSNSGTTSSSEDDASVIDVVIDYLSSLITSGY